MTQEQMKRFGIYLDDYGKLFFVECASYGIGEPLKIDGPISFAALIKQAEAFAGRNLPEEPRQIPRCCAECYRALGGNCWKEMLLPERPGDEPPACPAEKPKPKKVCWFCNVPQDKPSVMAYDITADRARVARGEAIRLIGKRAKVTFRAQDGGSGAVAGEVLAIGGTDRKDEPQLRVMRPNGYTYAIPLDSLLSVEEA